ncbi:MAG TPA: hypothetical protein IAC38_04175 [Candidatus Caccovivens faecavium]|nr:hypothetical protein [Candidatus Caccovivens faecavium]
MIGTLTSNHGFFRVKFKDMKGKNAVVIEKNEVEARKLHAILSRTLHAELFQQVNGKLEKLA